ncbi:472e3bed-0eb1-4807-835d-5ff55159e861 [Thermothielavioides terrestris]|uniref:472e3bed-0eb1-4807-835d-5ff55159e861 n=1 Tax=Thermothielavioides terrestris TaxID=2587410 RepID=A0A446BWW3_9PEZI|nr:472e3bed-0eb1-4807-835d-5ff55159e861 [Thermothielavioides terrestris]
MSTFNGLVAEFPDIRVDYFRPHPELRPPLACFLSHIHSDHLAGLESLRSPFVFCSAATKEMLLRLERYPCRINYANGILEARIQRYRHLRNLLKPIPLDTPTLLELEPGNHIQVTLLDANHCPGAVMFLFEGNGKAVLYTGDVRSEPWFVNSLARSPSLIEYSSGLKTLDTIYLDTSFLDNIEFPTKAEGIVELLQKVSRYPADTIFHFQAWTYGYEDVWIALSKFLQSKVQTLDLHLCRLQPLMCNGQIHVDEYKMSMFRSLVVTNPENKFAPSSHLAPEAPGLVGFMCGNNYHAGALTTDENVRLHSCEKGNYCNTVKGSQVVWIRPIITRLPNGQDVAEVGVGGGGDDLERDAELDYLSLEDVELLIEALCDTDNVPDDLRDQPASDTRHGGISSNNRIRYAYTRDFEPFTASQTFNDKSFNDMSFIDKSPIDVISLNILPVSNGSDSTSTTTTFLRFMTDETRMNVFVKVSETGLFGRGTRPGGGAGHHLARHG